MLSKEEKIRLLEEIGFDFTPRCEWKASEEPFCNEPVWEVDPSHLATVVTGYGHFCREHLGRWASIKSASVTKEES